jgi:hypothetical protein
VQLVRVGRFDTYSGLYLTRRQAILVCMTAVRQSPAAPKGGRRTASKATERSRSAKAAGAKKLSPREVQARGSAGSSQVAQVRLQPDEVKALHDVMQQLHLSSTSEALREGIRLLTKEAAEVAAAEDIRRFYGGRAAPVPEGVVSAKDEELAAADAERW